MISSELNCCADVTGRNADLGSPPNTAQAPSTGTTVYTALVSGLVPVSFDQVIWTQFTGRTNDAIG